MNVNTIKLPDHWNRPIRCTVPELCILKNHNDLWFRDCGQNLNLILYGIDITDRCPDFFLVRSVFMKQLEHIFSVGLDLIAVFTVNRTVSDYLEVIVNNLFIMNARKDVSLIWFSTVWHKPVAVFFAVKKSDFAVPIAFCIFLSRATIMCFDSRIFDVSR